MQQDAFGRCHPVVNILFYIGAIVLSAVVQHPVFLAAALVCGGAYYLLLAGKKAAGQMALLLPFGLLIALVNPIFNTRGQTVLFLLFGRPYTAQALLYGAIVAGILLAMLIWFGSYNRIMTGDKFTSLFANLAPSISLLLVMIFRLVPNLLRKISQIAGARRSIGKGAGEGAGTREKLKDGTTVLSAVTTWALEGSLVTGDSMRSRGYGCGRRSSFQLYRFGFADVILTAGILLGITAVILTAVSGGTAAEYTPQLRFAPLTGLQAAGFGVYCLYLLIPSILHGKEALVWHISRSKI